MDDIMLRNPMEGGGGGPRERLIGPKAYGPFSALRKRRREGARKDFWWRSDDVVQFGPKSATKNKHSKSVLKRYRDEGEPAVVFRGYDYGGIHLLCLAIRQELRDLY
jgi:hypothetical protein